MISITKREVSLSFGYTGESYDIQGGAITKQNGTIVTLNMSINDKRGTYAGGANVYVNESEKPQISISGVDVDNMEAIITAVKTALTELKAEITETVGNLGTEEHED